MQLSKTDLDIIQKIHKLEEKYGSFQGLIKALERSKVSRKEKQGKKIFLKLLRTVDYNRKHKNVKSQEVA